MSLTAGCRPGEYQTRAQAGSSGCRPRIITTVPDSELVVVFGGRSEIGLELATRLAGGSRVILAARGTHGLDDASRTLRTAGAAAVYTKEFDADDLAAHEQLVQEITTEHGPIGTAVLAFGVLGNQTQAEVDAAHAVALVHTDYVAQISLLTLLAQRMRAVGRGRIVVFSSIAGVRVRRANYVYGSAKAGLDGFANGLADALHGSGVRLLIVRSGFVVGRMTAGMTPTILSSAPAQVADAAARALARNQRIVWVPRAMQALAMATRPVPQSIWRRMPR